MVLLMYKALMFWQFFWAMTSGSLQLSGCCTQTHHLSSSHGQQPLPDTAPSSSGTWLWSSLDQFWPPCSHCGSARKATCQPYSGLGPGFMGSAWSETLKPKRHISWQTSWPVSCSYWVSSAPQCPCRGYPQPWPHHSAAGTPRHIRRTWGGEWT